MRVSVIAGCVLAAAAASASATTIAGAPPRSPCRRGLTTVERNPARLLPIAGTNPIAAATAAALRYERPVDKPQVRGALFAVADRQRGGEARFSCGTRVWRRTIVVYILDRASLPAESASQRVYFVGRFSGGYRVWQIVH